MTSQVFVVYKQPPSRKEPLRLNRITLSKFTGRFELRITTGGNEDILLNHGGTCPDWLAAEVENNVEAGNRLIGAKMNRKAVLT